MRQPRLWTSFGDVDGYIVTYKLTYYYVYTHTHTHIHIHTHVDTTHMQTYSMQMTWSCAALKQTRELSVHETVADCTAE